MINFGLMAEKVFDESQFNGNTAIIIGSGLGKLADTLNDKCIISYKCVISYKCKILHKCLNTSYMYNIKYMYNM